MTEKHVKLATIHGEKPGPTLLITGGVHGDEYTPMEAVHRLTECIDSKQLTGTVILIPIVNRPAFLLKQRTAEDGLDLARTCPGNLDGSITNQIAAELSAIIKSVDYFIDLHTGSNTLAVHPLVGYMLIKNDSVLQQQRQMAQAMNLPIIWGTSANLEGRSLSVARDAGIPAIYAEYLGSGVCDPFGVRAYTDGCVNILRKLQLLPGEVINRTPQYVVEDPRDNSGHMQIQNPSPATGFFRPHVSLGDCITIGDFIGEVIDIETEEANPVISTQNGVVIVLQTCSSIQQGESVGVILETEITHD